MEQREFLEKIHACRRRLNLAGALEKEVFGLCIGAVAGILFQAAAFVKPLYYANLYAGLALLSAFLAAFLAAYVKRSTPEQAALVMDSFGFEERIITAYEHLSQEGDLVALQREDAMRQLKEHGGRIQIPLLRSRKGAVLLSVLLALLLGLALAPSPVKERAGELHEIREQAREKEKEIEEVVEALEQMEREELMPEELAALQEMIESMQSSLAEYQQAASAEELAAAGEKLEYKYGNMSSQLSGLAQSLQNGAGVSLAAGESMQDMAERLREMSGQELPLGEGLADSRGQNNSNDNGDGQDTGNGQNGGEGSGSGNGQKVGQGSGGASSQNSGEGNESGSSQNGGNGQNSGQGSGSGNGQNSGQGSGSGNGQNSGQGSGSGNGQGGGQGQGDGSGQGGGSGNGRGTGSSSTSRDYVSVPNAIADSGNLAGNVTHHDDSEYFRVQNGLSWEGAHVSHEAVIGSYEKNAYEGIAAGRYPSGMEDVIKNYFASFN